MQSLEKLEDYSFLKIDKNKKDQKSSFVALSVDLNELEEELNKLKDMPTKKDEWSWDIF